MTAKSAPPPVMDVAIQSGGLYVSATPALIRTVLGSCVAACVYDPHARVGGMNHFILPDGCETNWAPTRFGSHAMETLLTEIARRGGDQTRLCAKIFGGAHVLRSANASRAIADDNVEFVRGYLAAQRIPIQAEKVGGNLPMMVRFETHTGKAFFRIIEASKVDEVAQDEARYLSKLNVVARQSERSLKVAQRHE